MNKRRVAILICAVALVLGALSLWMPTPIAAPPKTGLQPPDRCSSCPPPSERRIYAPAIELKEAERCEIVLNNRSPNPIDVTPTFYTANGHAVVGNPVQLQPAEIRFVPVEELMPEALRGQHRWGGIALSYTGNVLEVWAQITFHGVGGGSVDETFNILEEPGSDSREAVWRMAKKSTAVFALGNSSNVAIRTTAQFSYGDSEDVDIPAGATRFIRRHGGERNTASVKLTTAGPEGSMRVTGFIIAEDQSFTSSIRFYDTRKTVQSNLYATNLRLKNAVPRIVLKNTTDVDIEARPRFFAAAGEQANPVELPAITLRPQQVVEVDLSALRAAAASRTDFDSVSVQVLNSGAPGSLIGAAYSRERATELTHDVPLRDSGKIRNATGSYPWRVDQDYSTVVVITNIGNQAARFQVEIRYPGGPYSVKQRELAVGETATFDLRRMRDEQQPDRVGKTLPRDLERGQFHWSLVNTRGEPRIIGRAEVVSNAERVSSSYSCPTCCPDSGNGGGFDPNAYTLYVNGSAFTNGRGDYYDCYANWYTGSLEFSFLWTDNTSIATVNGTTGELQGAGAGQTAVGGDYDFTVWETDGMDCYSNYYSGSDNAPVDVDTLRVLVPNPPVTESNGSPGVIAGESFTIVLQAINASGDINLNNSSTVTVVSSRTLDSTEIGIPSSVTLSGGQYTKTIRLNRVSGTDRGTTFRFTPSGGGQIDFPIYTYFHVTATLEGLVGGTTACGHVITSTDHFVALPATGLCNTAVVVRNAASPLNADSTTVRDVGPWFPNTPGPGNSNSCSGGNDLYWNTGGVPRVLSSTCDTNNAAIDLANGTASSVSISGSGSVLWRFD